MRLHELKSKTVLKNGALHLQTVLTRKRKSGSFRIVFSRRRLNTVHIRGQIEKLIK